MSMHEIEGLIEDSVLLLNESKKSKQEKRELFFHLYNAQAMFDTGYTHFRVKDILEQNQFLLSLPLVDHPDYFNQPEKIAEVEKKIGKSDSTWLDDAICMRDKDSAALLVYYDYGSKLWQKLVDKKILLDTAAAPQPIALIAMAHNVMQEAALQDNKMLLLQWYVFTANCVAYEYADKSIYESFSKFIKDENVTHIKSLALANGIKEYDDDYHFLTKQEWQAEADLLTNASLEKQFIVRFCLDLEISNDELFAAYNEELEAQKELKKDNNKQKKIDLIPTELKSFLNKENGWSQISSSATDDEIHWIWYKDHGVFDSNSKSDSDSFYRQLIKVEFNPSEKGIHCFIGLQFGKILRWQKKLPDTNPVFWHHQSNFLVNFDFDDPENEKFVSFWGLWRFPLSQSIKKLNETLAVFSSYIKKEHKVIAEFALNEFNNKLFSRDCDTLTDLIENGEEGTEGVIPNYVIFDAAPMYPLLFLFNAIDQAPAGAEIKEDKQVKNYFKTFKESVDELHDKGASKLYLQSFVNLEKMIDDGMPAIIHMRFIEHYRKILDGKST